ncbi:MAG TPA: PQQ-dependent sugar dehydrogenase [Terriglobia bacterium]|nr:PQQ-dependent sugar dehydrogenase [Terriglobia bacterium]
MKLLSPGSRSVRTLLLASAGVGCLSLGIAARQAGNPNQWKLPDPGATPSSRASSRTVPRPDGAQLKLPAGFSASAYADNVANARLMVYAPNGDLFVSQPAQNTILVLREANGTVSREVFAQGTAPGARGGAGGGAAGAGGARGGPGAGAGRGAPGGGGAGRGGAGGFGGGFGQGGNNFAAQGPARGGAAAAPSNTPNSPFGLAFHNGYLYVGNWDAVIRYKYTNGDLKAQGPAEVVAPVRDTRGNHYTTNVLINSAGTKMYVAVGSSGNNNETDDDRRAAVTEYNLDGTGKRTFGSGLRNPVGLAWQPGTNALWTAVNERDTYGDDLVPDYATSVKDGGFYGWPWSYLGQNYDPAHVGKQPEKVKSALVPDVWIPAHSAALGLTFYTGTQFPEHYRNGLFVALHGSWNRSKAQGYRVVFVPFQNGKPSGPLEDFMSGFIVDDGSGGGITTWGRPVGVTVAKDGSLLVSDDTGNQIYKVSYSAPRR